MFAKEIHFKSLSEMASVLYRNLQYKYAVFQYKGSQYRFLTTVVTQLPWLHAGASALPILSSCSV